MTSWEGTSSGAGTMAAAWTVGSTGVVFGLAWVMTWPLGWQTPDTGLDQQLTEDDGWVVAGVGLIAV